MKKMLCITVCLFFLCGCGSLENADMDIAVETATGENAKNGWGFRKIPHDRPEFTKEQISSMEKNNCIYLGSEDDKVMYLTFDEGYENGFTPQILDVLKKHGVPAAFFITGPYFENQKEIVDRMVQEGHTVGNHTVNHPSLPDCSPEKIKSEISDLSDKFYDSYGITMKYLRPPMGEYSENTLKITSSMGYINVFWSFAYRDWETNNQKGADYAFESVTKYFHNGAVLLLHAVSKDNADALDKILTEAENQGYKFLPLDSYH